MINYPDPRSPLQIVLLFRFINSIIRNFFAVHFFLFFRVHIYNNSIYIFIPPTYILVKFRTLGVETPARNQWAHTLLTQQTTLGFVYEMATEPYLGYGTSFNTLLDITYMVSIVMIEIDRVISYISRTKVHASRQL